MLFLLLWLGLLINLFGGGDGGRGSFFIDVEDENGWEGTLAALMISSSFASSSKRRSCHRNALRSLRIRWLIRRPAEKCANGSDSR